MPGEVSNDTTENAKDLRQYVPVHDYVNHCLYGAVNERYNTYRIYNHWMRYTEVQHQP